MNIQRELVFDEDEKKLESSNILVENIDWAYVLHATPLWVARNENGASGRQFKSFAGVHNYNPDIGVGVTAMRLDDDLNADISEQLNLVNISVKNKVDKRNEKIQQGNEKIQNLALIFKFCTSDVIRNAIYNFIKENSKIIFSDYLKYFYFLYKNNTRKSDKPFLYQRAQILKDLYEKLKVEDIENISEDLYYPESEDLSNYSVDKYKMNVIELFMTFYTYTSFYGLLLDRYSAIFTNTDAALFKTITSDLRNQVVVYINQGLNVDDAINQVLTSDFEIERLQGNKIKFYDYITDEFMKIMGSLDGMIKGTGLDLIVRSKFQLHSELYGKTDTDYRVLTKALMEKWGMKVEDFDISDVELVPLEEEKVEYCKDMHEVLNYYYKDLNLIIKVLLCNYIRKCEFFIDRTITNFGIVLYNYLISIDFNVDIDIMSNDFYRYLNTFFITLLKYVNEVNITDVDTMDLDCITNGDMFKVKQFEERNLNYYFIYDGSGLLL